MSETGESEAAHELEPDDDSDGCELDFEEQPTSDAEINALLSRPAEPMKALSEEAWEQEEGS